MGRKVQGGFPEQGTDEQGRPCYRYGRDALLYDDEDEADADWRAVEQGYVSVSPLQVNITDEDTLHSLKAMVDGDVSVGQSGVVSTPEEDG